jgi:hypothetical protein
MRLVGCEVQAEPACLAHPQAHLGQQLRVRVVPGGRRELAGGRQFAAPAGEPSPDLRLTRRNPQLGVLGPARPVHLADRTRRPGPVIRRSSTLGRSSKNMTYVVSACDRPSRVPLGELPSTFPKYASASAGSMSHSGRPNQVLIWSKCPDVPTEGAVRQPCRGPHQEEPGQHVGLEPLQLLRRRGRPVLTQVAYDCRRRQPEPPHLRPDCGSVGRGENASGIPKSRHGPAEHTKEEGPPATGPGTQRGSGELTGCRTQVAVPGSCRTWARFRGVLLQARRPSTPVAAAT